jgi:hypothetical protein
VELGFELRACICKPGSPLLEPYLQSTFLLLCLFYSYKLFAWAGLPTVILISALQVSKITGVSHWHLAPNSSLIPLNIHYFCSSVLKLRMKPIEVREIGERRYIVQ